MSERTVRWKSRVWTTGAGLFVDQTEFGEQGNCMAACFATILGVPIDELPDLHALHADGKSWMNALNTYLVRHHDRLYVETQAIYTPFIRPSTDDLHLINGGSPRGVEGGHSVVGRGGSQYFDPHPSRDGLTSIETYGLLIPATDWHRQYHADKPCMCKRAACLTATVEAPNFTREET